MAMLNQLKKNGSMTAWFTAAVAAIYGQRAAANPEGMTVRAGQATASQNGAVLNVTASHNAFLDWRSFNIGAGETARFLQPSAAAVVWNRVNDPNPSQIYGRLEANGIVVLANQAGFYFGPNSFVQAAGFFATTAGIRPEMAAGSAWNFTGLPPLASIINYGHVQVDDGGALFLIAEKTENHGTLKAEEGNVVLTAGKEVLVSERPDGRGLSAKVVLPSGSVDNQGKILADGGTVAMHAQVVNQGGLIQANTVREHGGVIELVAGDAVKLGADSVLSATGGADAGAGGEVRIKGGQRFEDEAGSRISVAGGTAGGNGGSLAISAPQIARISSQLEGSAAGGAKAGTLTIDPDYVRISNSSAARPTDLPGTLVVTPSQYESFSQITLQADRDLTLDTQWLLADSADNTSLLSLQAGRNIQFAGGGSIVAGANWSVELLAGANFAVPGEVLPGAGSITLLGGASISTQQGFLHMYAGKDVLLNTGFAHTIGGGDIDVLAKSGNINTGTSSAGYSFLADPLKPYEPLANLGGISTAAGGDVRLVAGGDVSSYLPPSGRVESDAGSGAFGPQAGNVTVEAGGKVTGHFVVANGAGKIQAGTDAGTANSLLALSLVKGSWEVDARDIVLQQVRNPNAVFNSRIGANSHLFDYDPAASVRLNAFNGVTLSGQNVPVGQDRRVLASVYPPSLEVNAGAGGIALLNNLSLFPSPLGQLELNTTGGGSLRSVSAQGTAYELTLSDSAKNRFTTATDFGSKDHGAVPLHLGDTEPVRLNISGNLENVLVSVAKRAEVSVAGDVSNSGITAQNLHADDVTTIAVGGSVRNRSNLTFFENASAGPDVDLFNLALPSLGANPFLWNPDTKRITLVGRMTLTALNAYLNMRVQAVDNLGFPLFDLLGEPITVPAQFLDPAVLQYLYEHSQDVPAAIGASGTGFHINGPGKLVVAADSIDLGVTAGIVSHGPETVSALAPLGGGKGADIEVLTSGNLDMFSSLIASFAGGKVLVNAGGSINLGAPEFASDSSTPRGIYTVAKADVTVIANGDIDIQGSRIAAYDGGDILVRSLNGDVNAGNGGLGAQSVTRIRVNPETGEVEKLTTSIPGSGVLATSFPENSQNPVGNITVETPRGDINGGSGGVVQLSLNGVKSSASGVNLTAGSTLPDGTVIKGDINLAGSGAIGVNIKLRATGDISGNAIARENIDIDSSRNVTVNAVGGGAVSVSASGAVSGTLVGVGSVAAAGGSVDANILSQNIQAGTATSGQAGFATAAVASSTGQGAAAQAEGQKMQAKAETAETAESEEDLKKKKSATALVRTTGRVTVILPEKK